MNKKSIKKKSIPKIAIIILNWNGWKDTIECLESLYQITYPNYDVILVDNGSEDDSIKKIIEYCKGLIKIDSKFFVYNPGNKPINLIEFTKEEAEIPETKAKRIMHYSSNQTLIVIKNEKNYGFAEGNNIGIKFALKTLNSEYILLLNNDTVVHRDFLNKLIEITESNAKIGIVGPAIYEYSNQNEVQSAGVNFHWNTARQKVLKTDKINYKQQSSHREVDYVAGCCLLVKRKLIDKIGYLDSLYFAYWEEVDWCVRAKKLDYNIVCVLNTKIWHKGSITSNKLSGFHEYYMTRNMFLFMKKHASRIHYTLFLLYFFIFKFWFSSGIYIIYHKDIYTFFSFLKGVINGMEKNLS